MRKRRKVGSEVWGRGYQTRKYLKNPVVEMRDIIFLYCMSTLHFCLLSSAISQTTNNVLYLMRAKMRSFRPIEFKIKMFVNVTFPSFERFVVQCIPELSTSYIFSRALHRLHFPALATELHVFVSSSDLFSVRFAAVVVYAVITLVLVLLYERKCAFSTPVFARIYVQQQILTESTMLASARVVWRNLIIVSSPS